MTGRGAPALFAGYISRKPGIPYVGLPYWGRYFYTKRMPGGAYSCRVPEGESSGRGPLRGSGSFSACVCNLKTVDRVYGGTLFIRVQVGRWLAIPGVSTGPVSYPLRGRLAIPGISSAAG